MASNDMYTFWYSALHEAHLIRCSEHLGVRTMNQVKLDGVYHKYTCCSAEPDRDIQPFDHSQGVFNVFPDYVRLGEFKGYSAIRLGQIPRDPYEDDYLDHHQFDSEVDDGQTDDRIDHVTLNGKPLLVNDF